MYQTLCYAFADRITAKQVVMIYDIFVSTFCTQHSHCDLMGGGDEGDVRVRGCKRLHQKPQRTSERHMGTIIHPTTASATHTNTLTRLGGGYTTTEYACPEVCLQHLFLCEICIGRKMSKNMNICHTQTGCWRLCLPGLQHWPVLVIAALQPNKHAVKCKRNTTNANTVIHLVGEQTPR